MLCGLGPCRRAATGVGPICCLIIASGMEGLRPDQKWQPWRRAPLRRAVPGRLAANAQPPGLRRCGGGRVARPVGYPLRVCMSVACVFCARACFVPVVFGALAVWAGGFGPQPGCFVVPPVHRACT